MSTATMLEPFDTQMVDFDEDPDIAMAVSSSDNWIQNDSQMDEDAYVYQQYSHEAHVNEIEMAIYNETTEFEMADGEELRPSDQPELLDTELYDTSNFLSPIPMQPTELQTVSFDSANESVNLENSDIHAIHDQEASSSTYATIESNSNKTNSLAETVHDSGNTPTSPENTVDDSAGFKTLDPHYTDQALGDHSTTDENDNTGDGGVSHETYEVEHIDNDNQESEVNEDHSVQEVLPVEDRHVLNPDSAENNRNLSTLPEILHSESSLDRKGVAETQTQQDQERIPEETATGNQLLAESEELYLDMPPSILLSLRTSSAGGEQPEFALFAMPEISPLEDSTEAAESNLTPEEPLLLLQHRLNLYYEPISAVFEAFRHEEYFSHLEDLMEAEMALNVYDLQLTISEVCTITDLCDPANCSYLRRITFMLGKYLYTILMQCILELVSLEHYDLRCSL